VKLLSVLSEYCLHSEIDATKLLLFFAGIPSCFLHNCFLFLGNNPSQYYTKCLLVLAIEIKNNCTANEDENHAALTSSTLYVLSARASFFRTG
jgi:hypothetical protein